MKRKEKKRLKGKEATIINAALEAEKCRLHELNSKIMTCRYFSVEK